MSNLWLLSLHDGTELKIPPQQVETVQKAIADKKSIPTRVRMILPAEVKSFKMTAERYSPDPRPLLEAVAQAFNEPQYNEDGTVIVRWVKKDVPTEQYNRYYAPIGYRRLSESSGMTTIAFRLPVHMINVQKHDYCTADEERQLERT